ncbi:unnamed protein product [Vicia faba]|uniref:Glycoside hydrolase family 19 catalytic domain-containing protein n=1 Tax=Vicia faba TaxID=3906 RepID=A0AAV1APE0_VICFA|nr:unnamed protein product [Vicia faba]
MKENNPSKKYCEPCSEFPCAFGKEYYGRGPFQIRGNKVYGKREKTTPLMPSYGHEVMDETWSPSPLDILLRWYPGYGMATYCGIFGVDYGEDISCYDMKTQSIISST